MHTCPANACPHCLPWPRTLLVHPDDSSNYRRNFVEFKMVPGRMCHGMPAQENAKITLSGRGSMLCYRSMSHFLPLSTCARWIASLFFPCWSSTQCNRCPIIYSEFFIMFCDYLLTISGASVFCSHKESGNVFFMHFVRKAHVWCKRGISSCWRLDLLKTIFLISKEKRLCRVCG